MGIVYTNEISVAHYNALRQSAGWQTIHPVQAADGLNGSALLVAAYDGARAVGVARLVWDGGYAALVKDVLVLPEYQGQGIGTEMMQQILQFLRSKLQPGYLLQIDLMAAIGKEGFYEKLDFEARPRSNRGAGMDLWLRGAAPL